MIEQHQIRAFRNNVAAAFKAGMPLFPLYTLHGSEHLEELDRLCSLITGSIPRLAGDEEAVNVLRLALVLHDLAMVDVVSGEREEALRAQMGPDISLADLVRQTHQDEVQDALTRRSQELFGCFPSASLVELNDAVTIARFHRFHPLYTAPKYLKARCALMRVIDELDIGPARAPLSTYKSLRNRMDPTTRFHWLKHLCSRPVAKDSTFFQTIRNDDRELEIFVAVQATSETWRCLQQNIHEKLAECLDTDGVGDVIQDLLSVRMTVEPMPETEFVCGTTTLIAEEVRTDLEALSGTRFCDQSRHAEVVPEGQLRRGVRRRSINVMQSPELTAADEVVTTRMSEGQLRIVAIPPEKLAVALARAGRLSIIGNEYIPQKERTIGGVSGAASRIYVGPADCGKTRAALEWIDGVMKSRPGPWVVLRSDMGKIPERIDDLVLDRSLYDPEHPIPQRAILFLDDLPTNLPTDGAPTSATDSLQRLFAWFAHHPYFKERRLVGTIRAEDLHARPGWPEVLPALGVELELVALADHSADELARLWHGMSQGTVSVSQTQGEKPFRLTIDQDFVKEVAGRQSTPEAIATFVLGRVTRRIDRLNAADADKFRDSAVELWLQDTWPVVRGTYGSTASVFYTLARFLEAGLRPGSGFKTGLIPDRSYHAAFGPDLCALNDVSGDYLEAIERMCVDGHAVGRKGTWIRPKWDFILQAERIGAVEVPLPEPQWFAERSARLSPEIRVALIAHLVAAGRTIATDCSGDDAWFFAHGVGKEFAALAEGDVTRQKQLRAESLSAYRQAVDTNAKNDRAWFNLGVCLAREADEETDTTRQVQLRADEIAAYRSAVEANPKNGRAWFNLGTRLNQQADATRDAVGRQQLLTEAIAAYQHVVEANAEDDEAWFRMAACFSQQADAESDAVQREKLRSEEIAGYRQAVQINIKNDKAWFNLGICLGQRADAEPDEPQRDALHADEIAAYRQASQANIKNDRAWLHLGLCLLRQADKERSGDQYQRLCLEAKATLRQAVEVNIANDQAWYFLGLCLGLEGIGEPDKARREQLCAEEIAAFRKAAEVNERNGDAWYDLSAALTKLWRTTSTSALLDDAIDAGQKAVSMGKSHYNLSCALALADHADEAFQELTTALEAGNISWSHVDADQDWASYRNDPRYIELRTRFSKPAI